MLPVAEFLTVMVPKVVWAKIPSPFAPFALMMAEFVLSTASPPALMPLDHAGYDGSNLGIRQIRRCAPTPELPAPVPVMDTMICIER